MTVAALDLGSNSFHLMVAREDHGQLRVLDRDRVRVALASGLRKDRTLEDATIEFALKTLERFGQRLRDMPPEHVRAVGTNTLRRLRDGGAFVARAEQALGHPVDVIAGTEEARLIYLGVAHHRPRGDGRRLVVDIGGGSTECIIGEGFEPLERASLPLGCVTYESRYFRHGKIDKGRFARAVLAAQVELRAMKRRFRELGWNECIGASGTVRAAAEILRAHGGDGTITMAGLDELRRIVLAARNARALAGLPGMPEDRAPVLASGLAVLTAIFRSFRIERMVTCDGALREGVLYDLLGRFHDEDVRERSIRMLARRHHVDEEQALRVEHATDAMRAQVEVAWQLADGERRNVLAWAARLHEVGLSVSYGGHHKHGAYLIEHGDLPGFSREQQRLLAVLVRTHRRKVPADAVRALPERERVAARRMIALLRLAVLLNRSRSRNALPVPALAATAEGLDLRFAPGVLDHHLMTRVDLKEERAHLRQLGIRLRYT